VSRCVASGIVVVVWGFDPKLRRRGRYGGGRAFSGEYEDGLSRGYSEGGGDWSTKNLDEKKNHGSTTFVGRETDRCWMNDVRKVPSNKRMPLIGGRETI